jgi:hypothetical protein
VSNSSAIRTPAAASGTAGVAGCFPNLFAIRRCLRLMVESVAFAGIPETTTRRNDSNLSGCPESRGCSASHVFAERSQRAIGGLAATECGVAAGCWEVIGPVAGGWVQRLHWEHGERRHGERRDDTKDGRALGGGWAAPRACLSWCRQCQPPHWNDRRDNTYASPDRPS